MTVSPTTQRARALRRDMTDAERRLWHALRAAELPCKVRRQHPIGPFIADFAVPARKLVIEIDGGQHAMSRDADEARSRCLASEGYRVIRFWNGQVMNELDDVLNEIIRVIEHSGEGR